MLKWMNHLRIGTKLFSLLILATVVIVGSNVFLMQTLKSTSEKLERELYDELYHATYYLLNADRDFYQAEQAFMGLQADEALSNELVAEWTADFHENTEQVVERMNTAKEIFLSVDGLESDQVTRNFDDFFQGYEAWRAEVEILVTNLIDVDAAELERLRNDFDQIRDVVDVLQQDLEQTAVAKVDTLQETNQRQMAVSWSMIIVCIIIVFALGFALIRHITKPVARLVHHMQEIASGNLRLDVNGADSKRRDEIGQLAKSGEAMLRYLRDMVQRLNQISGHVDQQSEVLAKAADEVRSGAEQVAATMEELSAGSEEQASSSSEISSLIEELNKQIAMSNNAGVTLEVNAKDVHQASEQGKQEMERSVKLFEEVNALVADSTEQVKRLEVRIEDISKLSVVIKGIAEQTNLLALNAAIEAARAGESGLGFAVVSAEVRKLAEQVDASVAEISGIIKGIQSDTRVMVDSMEEGHEKVANGNRQIHVSHKHFSEINAAVSDMIGRIRSVTGSLVQIADGSEKVSRATTEIAAASEQSAAGIEQCAATAQQQNSAMQEVASHAAMLKKRSNELNDIVKQFSY